VEAFGIILSIPGAFVATWIYRWIIVNATSGWPRLRPPLLAASYLALGGVAVEWILLQVRGPVGTRLLLGPAYNTLHFLIFLGGVPALLNVLVLPVPGSCGFRWRASLPLCTILGFVLVLQSYTMFESLYGVDGVGGPFSQAGSVQ
jgi:hypothetical protein